ncbi:hypothetical protein N0V93_005666 [Gnomoniopsis smithogilvyi]|uniref:Uncharacterized protein n=1 Tax=Gnomoniopsis smithogilvyi TaxID=1191159 RepID=A0A9W9CY86_9PEZI|nr:hypothetical protein N0V93_005666 [Gnomoniopsis smithogilvyi]
MASNQDPPSQDDGQLTQSDVVNGEEPSLAVDAGVSVSPAPSGNSSVHLLTGTDSAASDKISMRSHTSIPVVGTFPLGSLRVHKAMDSPRCELMEASELNTSDMPSLEGDEDIATAATESPVSGGDVFLLLDLLPNSTVGCDAKAMGTGTSQFQGIRDIPPGSHFIWVSEPNAMSRCGYWFLATPQRQQVRVKQWDKFNEVLVTPASEFEARDMRDNVAQLYPQLIPYGTDGSSSQARTSGKDDDAALLWRQLTACISEKLLARVTGKNKPDVGEWLVDTSDSAAGEDGFPRTKTTTQTYQTLVGTGELNFLFPEGDVDLHTATGLDEDLVPDTSMDILRLLDTPGTGVTEADLIGELQFTFLTGLHLSNLACIEQWWHLLLKIFLRAHKLVNLRPGLSLAFLTTLHSQMVYNETYISPNNSSDDAEPQHEYGGTGGATSLLDVIPGNKRKLRQALTLYKRRMNELLLNLPGGLLTSEQGQVGKAFVEVEEWFWKLGWDLRTDYVKGEKDGKDRGADDDLPYDEDDEYKPVIVDLDDHGREVGLVSFT